MLRREAHQDIELSRRTETYKHTLFQANAIRVAPNAESLFTLRNGTHSWIFVDHGLLLPNPQTNRAFVDAMSYAIQTGFPHTTILANVDSKSSPQTTGALAYELGLKQIAVNPDATVQVEHGTGLRLRMPEVHAGDTILIVDDVMTLGDKTALNVAQMIRSELGDKSEGVQIHLLVGLMRDPKSIEELAQHGITAHSLVTLREVLGNNLGQLQLTEAQREGLRNELLSR